MYAGETHRQFETGQTDQHLSMEMVMALPVSPRPLWLSQNTVNDTTLRLEHHQPSHSLEKSVEYEFS